MLPPVDKEFENRAILIIRIWDYIQTHTNLDAEPEHTQRIGFVIRYQGEYFATLRQRENLWFVYPYNADVGEFTEITDAISYLVTLCKQENSPVL